MIEWTTIGFGSPIWTFLQKWMTASFRDNGCRCAVCEWPMTIFVSYPVSCLALWLCFVCELLLISFRSFVLAQLLIFSFYFFLKNFTLWFGNIKSIENASIFSWMRTLWKIQYQFQSTPWRIPHWEIIFVCLWFILIFLLLLFGLDPIKNWKHTDKPNSQLVFRQFKWVALRMEIVSQ